MKRLLTYLLSFAIVILCHAEVPDDIESVPIVNYDLTDSIGVAPSDSLIAVADTTAVPPAKRNFIQKVIDYFSKTNEENLDKPIDFSIIGGPYYSSDTKFGLGIIGAAQYRTDREDLTLPRSDAALYGNFSTAGFVSLGIVGHHIAPRERYLINYRLGFYYEPAFFWGIGYENCDNDANKTKLKRIRLDLEAHFLFRLSSNLYAGPFVDWDYVNAKAIEDMTLLEGQKLKGQNLGVGGIISYDSRDVVTNAHSGIYAKLTQSFHPSWLGNGDYHFSTTAFEFDTYNRVWKGGVVAAQVLGEFNFGNPPWSLMAFVGGSHSLRGYYEGRYRDKHKLEAQVELRQHIYSRSSAVFWVGLASVFHDKETFKKLLPNVGIGYRWEFKKDMNIRLDIGFGKSKQYGVVFSINEAF